MSTPDNATNTASENNFLLRNINIISGASLTKVQPTAKAAADWAAGLPLMHVGRTSEQLLAMLHELSKADMNESTRLEIMEAIRKPIKSITASLSKHFFVSHVQLTDLSLRIFYLNIEFKAISAQIYFHIAQRLSDELQTRTFGLLGISKKKAMQTDVALAIHRAISELCSILFDSQMLYRPAPAKAWARLHYLFALACKQDLQDHSIYDPQLKFYRKSTIASAYKAAILLSIINNGHLKQPEMTNIKWLLEIWADKVVIQSNVDENSFLLINQQEDAPPFYKPIDLSKLNQARHFYVNLTQLSAYLNGSDFLNPSSRWFAQESAIGASLLNHIKELFAQPIERTNTRYPESNKHIEAIFGLNAIYYHLNNMREFITPVELSFDLSGLSLDPNATTQNKADYPLYHCDVANTSAGGVGLKWPQANANPLLKSGELILYRDCDQSNWQIGVIRWLKHTQANNIDFGVQLLSLEVYACEVAIHSKNQTADHIMRGLLLSDTQHTLTPLSVITVPYGFNRNLKIKLTADNTKMDIELTNRILDTGSFMQHALNVKKSTRSVSSNPQTSEIPALSALAKQDSTDNPTELSLERFNDLWGEI